MLNDEQLASVDELLDTLMHAAAVLTESIIDPAVLEAAPLNHRASALSAVGRVMRVLARLKAASIEAEDDRPHDDRKEIFYLDLPDAYRQCESEEEYAAWLMENANPAMPASAETPTQHARAQYGK